MLAIASTTSKINSGSIYWTLLGLFVLEDELAKKIEISASEAAGITRKGTLSIPLLVLKM
jgi:hypothetical protein